MPRERTFIDVPALPRMMDRERVEAFLMGHRDRRPLMRATDYYKLIYQGVFGVGHIMGVDAWGWLEREAEGLDMGDQPDEPLMETISVDGVVVRVNPAASLLG